MKFQVQKEMANNNSSALLPREQWDTWDPMLISEGLFAAANIFRFIFFSVTFYRKLLLLLQCFCIVIFQTAIAFIKSTRLNSQSVERAFKGYHLDS